MKQEVKFVAIVLAAIILFASGFGLGATKGITIKVEGAAVQTGGSASSGSSTATPAPAPAPAESTTAAPAPQTSAPAADAPAADAPAADAPAGDAGASAGSVPSTPAEVATAFNKAINDFKAYTGNATMKRTEVVAIEVKDLPALAASVVNKVVESFTGTKNYEYVFTNGVDAEGNKCADRIMPWGRNANVVPEGLASASATANADGGYTMNMKFVAEDSIFDGTQNTSEPTYHMGAMDPLDLSKVDLGGAVSITGANLHYPGATVECVVDGQGRLTKYYCVLPLEGSGSGKAVVSLTLNMAGSMDSTFEISYN